MTPPRRRLNLGCGHNVLDGWINLDSQPLPGVEVVFDLDTCATGGRLPFDDGSIDEFLLSHLLEHIREPLPLMQEAWRIAAPGARMTVKVPHGGNDEAWTDPTHRRPYFAGSFGYFGQPYYWRADYGYRGDWRMVKTTLVVDGPRFAGARPDQILAEVNALRNVVHEMVVELEAVKPARPADRDLQEPPVITIRLAS